MNERKSTVTYQHFLFHLLIKQVHQLLDIHLLNFPTLDYMHLIIIPFYCSFQETQENKIKSKNNKRRKFQPTMSSKII